MNIGFEEVKADCVAKQLTVTGKKDPAVMKEMLEEKTKKRVELVSPQPREDDRADKKPQEKSETEEEYEKPKEVHTLTCSLQPSFRSKHICTMRHCHL